MAKTKFGITAKLNKTNQLPHISLIAPMAYWTFDDAQQVGTSSLDLSGNGYTANHWPSKAPTSGSGFVNEAKNFDGNQALIIPGPRATDFRFSKTDSFSCSWWARYTGSSGNEAVFSSVNLGIYPGWAPGGSLGNVGLTLSDSGFANRYSAVTVERYDDNQWHNFVVTYDGSEDADGIAVFVNGVSASMEIIVNLDPGDITTGTPAVVIGGAVQLGGLVSTHSGSIDEMAIWDSQLTALDAQAVYNRGVLGYKLI